MRPRSDGGIILENQSEIDGANRAIRQAGIQAQVPVAFGMTEMLKGLNRDRDLNDTTTLEVDPEEAPIVMDSLRAMAKRRTIVWPALARQMLHAHERYLSD